MVQFYLPECQLLFLSCFYFFTFCFYPSVIKETFRKLHYHRIYNCWYLLSTEMPAEWDFHYKWMDVSCVQNSSVCLIITAAGRPLLQPAWPPRVAVVHVLNIIIQIQVSGSWENLRDLKCPECFSTEEVAASKGCLRTQEGMLEVCYNITVFSDGANLKGLQPSEMFRML